MASVKCKAIVVSETSYNENDKMLTAISDSFGKISISVRGAKKPNSKFLAVSQIFCYSEMELSEGKNGIYTLTDSTLLASFYDLRTDLDCLYTAERIVKTASKISQEELPDISLLRLVLNTLYAINSRIVDYELAEAIFNIRAVYDQGVLPEYSVKNDGTVKALNYVVSVDYSKLFSFGISDNVLKELVNISAKAIKNL